MELQLIGYAQPITQTQWNVDSLVMRHQPHRYNGITIIWLCTINNKKYNGSSTVWLCTTNYTDTMELQLYGYAPLTTRNFDSLVMHH